MEEQLGHFSFNLPSFTFFNVGFLPLKVKLLFSNGKPILKNAISKFVNIKK
jgi:hypothetical protein